MAKPAASEAALDLYAALDPPFTQFDEEHDWAALKFCMALTAGNIDLIHELVTEAGDRPPWQILFDPENCPEIALPYLAQFVGARISPDMSEAQIREAIREPQAFRRGTIPAIEEVAKRRLTGTKTVIIEERYTGLPWRLRIVTLVEETPDPATTEREITEEQKPIGILLFFNRRANWTWGEIKAEIATYPTWLSLRTAFATWFIVRTHEP